MKLSLLLLIIPLGFSCCPEHCSAASLSPGSIGVRGGLTADNKDSYLHQYEAFAMWQLPLDFRARSGWGLSTQLGFTAGVLKGAGEYGMIGSLGPALSLNKTGFPVDIDLGISAAVLSRDIFGSRDYNGLLQFISHTGISARLTKNLGLGYRFQHMSNAGLNGSPNPGINLHLFGVSWYFGE